MTRCHICDRSVDHDHDPHQVATDPGHYDDEQFEVAMGNHLFVRSCWSCWMKWPDEHKRQCGEFAAIDVYTRPAQRVGLDDFADLVPGPR